MGLGLDYQATLLSAMAEAGGGNFHYVESSSRIVGVFDAEFRGLRSLVAKGVRLTLTPQEGTEIIQVVEWNAEQKGSAFSVNVGDIESGRSTKIVARLRVPTGRTVDAANVLSISFRGEDARTSETLAPSPLVLGVGFTKSAEEARASIDKDVQHDFVTAQVSVQLEVANAAAARGDETKCKDALETLRRSGVRELRYRGADGKDSVMALEEYEKRALKGDAGQRQDAQNLCKSAAVQAGK